MDKTYIIGDVAYTFSFSDSQLSFYIDVEASPGCQRIWDYYFTYINPLGRGFWDEPPRHLYSPFPCPSLFQLRTAAFEFVEEVLARTGSNYFRFSPLRDEHIGVYQRCAELLARRHGFHLCNDEDQWHMTKIRLPLRGA